ncbi:hypothetical protein [Cytobacillus sp. IB215665]|uniref:hypothetical protein n=1 Tax=Cytobacillus sp. IB215665 TaxID=3097357 RepID=UPI002A16A3A5|nr:hypothetical protein [Cytobacillus sp. IB215665]MDX8367803.1 hypothetical protein [Cytobacillus sp. IB215665]
MDMDTWERLLRIIAWSVGILAGLTAIAKNLLDLKDRKEKLQQEKAHSDKE